MVHRQVVKLKAYKKASLSRTVSKLLDLSLQVGGDAWNLYAKREMDPAFADFSRKVLIRDNYRCSFCGFSAKQHMKVINLDGNYTNNKLSNLATACPFCQQSLFLEAAGKLQLGGGTIIYLPEMSQSQLSALCHVLYAAIVNGSQHARSADSYIQSLKLRSRLVEKHYGKHMSDPSFMGQMILDSPGVDPQTAKDKILSKVRLLPLMDKFETQIVAWARTTSSNS